MRSAVQPSLDKLRAVFLFRCDQPVMTGSLGSQCGHQRDWIRARAASMVAGPSAPTSVTGEPHARRARRRHSISVGGADVDGEIESLGADCVRQLRKSEAQPPFAPVNIHRVVARERRDVYAGIRARGNSEPGLAAGVSGIRRIAALVGEDAFDCAQKFGAVRVTNAG